MNVTFFGGLAGCALLLVAAPYMAQSHPLGQSVLRTEGNCSFLGHQVVLEAASRRTHGRHRRRRGTGQHLAVLVSGSTTGRPADGNRAGVKGEPSHPLSGNTRLPFRTVMPFSSPKPKS